MTPIHLLVVAALAIAMPAGSARAAEVDAATVEYATLGGRPVTGYLARPASAREPLPALVAIHPRRGPGDAARARTRRLAAAGYIVLGVDPGGGRPPASSQGAAAPPRPPRERSARIARNLRQAFYRLEVMPATGRIGSIGWCVGGAWSLRLATLLPRALDAAVVHQGRPVVRREALASIEAPIQGHFLARDTAIPRARVRAFARILSELDARHEIHVYEDPADASAAARADGCHVRMSGLAWRRTLSFLERVLAPWEEGRERPGASARNDGTAQRR